MGTCNVASNVLEMTNMMATQKIFPISASSGIKKQRKILTLAHSLPSLPGFTTLLAPLLTQLNIKKPLNNNFLNPLHSPPPN